MLLIYSIFPPYWWPLTALNNDYKAQQDSIQQSVPIRITKGGRLYKGILITKAGLMAALKVEFTKYGIEDQLGVVAKIIACESSWNILADNSVSYGLLQFTPATWKQFGYGDIMNPYSQIKVMAKMWHDKLQHRWDCYSIVN
jgi:hypothetical protein